MMYAFQSTFGIVNMHCINTSQALVNTMGSRLHLCMYNAYPVTAKNWI